MKDLFWLEINLSHLKHNVKNLKKLLKPETKLMAVVKSNAYGHGMIECARTAIKSGADWLGVVNLNEALTLRRKIQNFPILVMGYTEPEKGILALQKDISIGVFNFTQLNQLKHQMLKRKSPRSGQRLKIHLKIETGISRLGFPEKDWLKLIKEVKKLPQNIQIEGIYSHFASVEEYDLNYAQKQINNFKRFRQLFEENFRLLISKQPLIYHISASAAAMILPQAHFDMVRCGIAIYGLWPSREIREAFSRVKNLKIKNYNRDFLKPVLSYKTKVVQIKEVKRGDFIGYGCTYPVDKPMTIGVIPIGYAEGFDRGFSYPSQPGNKGGEVLIRGVRCPVVGRVCMNMIMIDISRLKVKTQMSNVKIGEEAVLIGRQGNNEITVDEWAEKLGTINYEITTRIPERIERKYIR